MANYKRLLIQINIILFMLVFSQPILSQSHSKADSLLSEIQKFDAVKAASSQKGLTLRDTIKADLLSALSQMIYQAEPEKAIGYSQKQYAISKAIGYRFGMANALEVRGHIYDYQREYDKSLSFYLKALQMHHDAGNKIGIVDVNNSIGVLYSKRSNYPDAHRYLLVALRSAQKEKDYAGIFSSSNNIGLIYKDQGKIDEALHYYFKSLAVHQYHSEIPSVSNVYHNVAEIFRLKKNPDKALENAFRGLTAAKTEGDSLSLANNISTMAEIYRDLGQYDKALEHQTTAALIRKKINDNYGLFSSFISFSNIYSKKGANEKALLYANNALQLVNNNDEIGRLASVNKRLSDIHATMKEYDKAYHYQLMFKKYSDSIFNSEIQRELTEQRMNFEFSQRQEKSRVEAKEALDLQKRLRYYTVAGLALVGVLIIFLLVRWYSRRSQKKQQEYKEDLGVLQQEIEVLDVAAQALKMENENIQLKNELIVAEKEFEKAEREKLQDKLDFNHRELASSTLYLFQKNQMLSELKTEIDALKKGGISSENIDRIKSAIQQNLYLDADWEKFKRHFEQVHPDFFKELLVQHPTLTAYEVRLYAYLHMKLSTKEIAGLLNITPASVIKAKVRLNKKLNRGHDRSNDDTL